MHVLHDGDLPPSLHLKTGLFWKDVPDQPFTWAMNLSVQPRP